VQEEVITWFKGQAAEFYDSGIQKLVPRLNRYLGNAVNNVEKQSYVQVIHSQCRFCKLKMLYLFKTFVSLLSGHASYIYIYSHNRPVFLRDCDRAHSSCAADSQLHVSDR